jgi:multicomponent Na+:H+ antiporter subunit E
VWELVLANLRLARDVVGPIRRLSPGIVAVPLDVKTDAEIALLANLITLTPGTLSLDVSSDGRVLFVHAVSAENAQAVRSGIKAGFERRVRRLFA